MQQRLGELLAQASTMLLVCDFVQPTRTSSAAVPTEESSFNTISRRLFVSGTIDKLDIRFRKRICIGVVAAARFEAHAARHFDHCIMVSTADCRTMADLYGVRTRSAIPTVLDVSTSNPESRGSRASRGVHGFMDWLPNRTRFGSSCAMSCAHPEVLDVTFWIVGREPSSAVRRLGANTRT